MTLSPGFTNYTYTLLMSNYSNTTIQNSSKCEKRPKILYAIRPAATHVWPSNLPRCHIFNQFQGRSSRKLGEAHAQKDVGTHTSSILFCLSGFFKHTLPFYLHTKRALSYEKKFKCATLDCSMIIFWLPSCGFNI